MTEKITTVLRIPSQAKLKQAIRPYAFELGSLVFCWNKLHENLADLFTVVTGLHKARTIAHAIWHSTNSDLAQRKMLRAAVEAALHKDSAERSEVLWLLSKVDHFLSDKRNDAFHTPFELLSGENGIRLTTNWVSLSPRAKKNAAEGPSERIQMVRRHN